MNKEELMKYVTQAVEALNDSDVEALFPDTGQPDLNVLVEELVGLRGEVRKLAQSTLKVNHDVQTMIEQQKDLAAQAKENLQIAPMPVFENATDDTDEYKEILLKILEQDDIMQRTSTHFKTLPGLGFFNLSNYRQQMASWTKGYEISFDKWQKLIKSSGLYATGKIGETFNPVYHEAIATKTDTTKGNNTILEIEVLGYIRKQKIVRRAKVVVNKIE
jgi:hypothetical protein